MRWVDVRLAARRLCRGPGFAAAAILLLAVSIGGPTFVFSVVRALLFQTLPYSEPERLVVLRPEMPPGGELFSDLQARRDLFETVAAYTERAANLGGDGPSERVQIARVTSSYLAITGVRPSAGRLLVEADFQPGSVPVALISNRLWQHRYGRAAAVGRSLVLDGRPHTIVGVLPPDFKTLRQLERAHDFPFDREAAVYVPLPGNPHGYDQTGTDRKLRGLTILARLRRAVTVDGAAEAVAPLLTREQMRASTTVPFYLTSLSAAVAGTLPAQLALLSAAVAVLLVVGMANVMNLLLARLEARRRELATCVAIGASAGRVAGDILAETLLISAAGGALGVLVARQAMAATKLLAGAQLDLEAVTIGLPELTVAALLSLGTGLVVGLGAARRHVRTDPAAALQPRGAAPVFGPVPLPSVLVVAQVALAVVLVAVGTVLVRGFARLANTDMGFETRGILTAEISLDNNWYWRRAAPEFLAGLLDRVRALPGVERSALVSTVPGGEFSGAALVRVRGRSYFVDVGAVSRDYFELLSIRVIAGSVWTHEGTPTGTREIVVNETFARDHFGVVSRALGEQVTFGLPPVPAGQRVTEPVATIVGVVADSRDGFVSTPPRSKIYRSYAQSPMTQMTILVRAANDRPAQLAQPLARVVRDLHPDPTVYNVLPLETIVESRLARERTTTAVMTAFATLTLLVAALGVYAAMAHAGALRRHEVGVRLALGGTRGSILRTLAWRGVKIVSVGVEIGILFAVVAVSVLRASLPGTGRTDVSTMAATVALVALVSAVALLVPAWRATRVDPMSLLRAE
jgi:predicted permease